MDRPIIYVQYSETHDTMRRWQTTPFDGGIRYDSYESLSPMQGRVLELEDEVARLTQELLLATGVPS